MRLTFALVVVLPLFLRAAPLAHADEGLLDEKKTPASASAFDDTDSDKPPSTDEYKNSPDHMMLPKEAQPSADSSAESTLSSGGKAGYETLMKMYQQKKYDEVAKELEPLARGGHHGAEEVMGIMYRYGQGVPKDAKKAFEYLQAAANTNRPVAQYHLGTMYFTGEGVEADSVTALMWLHIANVHFADGPEKQAVIRDRDNLYTHMTRRDKERALLKAREWLNKRGEGHLLDLDPQ